MTEPVMPQGAVYTRSLGTVGAGMYTYTTGQMLKYAEQAVAAERERCAKVAEDFLTKGRSPLGRSVAAAIRGAWRGN
jgi:hypothetical protein